MDYERKDTMKKAKSGKEPQKLDLEFGAGKPSSLEANEAKRVARRELINREFNKIVKDKF